MLAHLEPKQRALAELMSELSERAYYAGWMEGLEFSLWRALDGGSRTFGRLELTDDQLVRLRQLADACGGWIVFDDMNEERFVPISEWKKRL